MQQLRRDVIESRRHAYAVGTYNNMYCHWVKYLIFCIYFKLVAFPAQSSVLAWYAQYLSRCLKSHASIINYLSSVKTLHKMLNYKTVGFTGFMLKLTLQGLSRLNAHTVSRAKPVTPAILRAIHAQLNHQCPDDAVFWTTCLMAFFLLFRKSNLIPDTKSGFDPKRQLTRGDVVLTDINAVVGIRWAKNHQFSRELMTFPLPKLPGSVLCPHSALHNMMRLVKGPLNQHLFALKAGGSLFYKSFQDKLRLCLKLAGIQDHHSYSSHSFRCGGCTFSFLCGIPAPIIKLLGNWKSDSYLAYLEFPLETQTAASEMMKQRLLAWEDQLT